jgi:hypothetical protein
MKKLLGLLLAATMCLFAFTACKDTDDTPDDGTHNDGGGLPTGEDPVVSDKNWDLLK